MTIPSLVAIAGLAVWALFEIFLRRRDDPSTASWQAEHSDRHSTAVLMIAYAVALAMNVALSLGTVGQIATPWRWIGVGVVAAGLALRAWSMNTLGRSYTRTLRTTDEQHLIDEGPYHLIRHPGYGGSLLVWIGYSIGIGNIIAATITLALLLAAYSWRINAEEALLADTFGPAFTEYQAQTKRLIPYLY